MTGTVAPEVYPHVRGSAHPVWTLLTAVSGISDEFERARLAATGLPSLLQCQVSGIALVDADESTWTIAAQQDGRELAPDQAEKLREELAGLFHEVSRRPILRIAAANGGPDDIGIPTSMENLGIRSLVLVPLRTLRHRLGMVFVGKKSPTEFSRDEGLCLSTLAEHFAVGVENLRFYATLEQDSEKLRHLVEERTQKLQRYTKRLEVLREIDRAILAADSPQAIAQAAMLHISELVPCLRASVGLFDDEADESIVLAINFRGETKLALGARFPSKVYDLDELRRGGVQFTRDTESSSDESTDERLRAEGVRSWFGVPLLARDELIGVLNVASDEVSGFSSEHIEIAREVADSLAIAIQQAQLYDQLHRQAADLEKRVAERTAALEAFSYSVSHDLRAPLRAIDGFSRVLLEDYGDKLDSECKRLLNIICSNTGNMGQLIDDLLAFSRLGRQEMRVGKIDMAGLAKAVFDELRMTAPERAAHLSVGALPCALADRSLIRQVFVNLLSNAIKFTRTRETAALEVGCETEDGENIYYVKDNGVGFDARYAEKLFGVFQRLHTNAEFEGTGVGLAIVHSIIKRHGGRVWADAAIDGGATIYFTLPPGSPGVAKL